MNKKKKIIIVISISVFVLMIIFWYPICFLGNLVTSYYKYRDRTAIVSLDDQTSIEIVMKCKFYPGQSLIISVYDSDGNELFYEDIKHIVSPPLKYVDSKDSSWKTVELIKDENGTKTYEAIWGMILLKPDGTISIIPK